jgi:hypothetical protein
MEMNSTRPSLLTRRRVIGFGVASVLAIALADCVRGDPLQIGLQSWGGFQLLRLAERHGWIDEAPLQLVDFASSAVRPPRSRSTKSCGCAERASPCRWR